MVPRRSTTVPRRKATRLSKAFPEFSSWHTIFQLAHKEWPRGKFSDLKLKDLDKLSLTNYVIPWASPLICLSLRTLFRQVGLYLIT